MDVYRENGVTVISDEIWSDIILGGHKHIPTQSVSEDARQRTIALYAPSKTFQPGRAGRKLPHHIQQNAAGPCGRPQRKTHYNEMNVLSMHALLGAYTPRAAPGWTSCAPC